MSFRTILIAFGCAFFITLTSVPTFAEEKSSEDKKADSKEEATKEKDNKKADSDKDKPKVSITEGKVTIAGKELAYTATASKIFQKSDSGDEKAELFFTAYTAGELDEEGEPKVDHDRPITFCFNGGPGSSSVWLHLGMLGPRRISLPDDASFAAPPYDLIDNKYSLLDKTDLVFIDPVGTGYSRPSKGEKKDQFHGLEEDLRSVSQFIHDYTSKYKRWSSPKYILGESYGGLRAGGLAERLQDRYRMYLNGVILVSAVLDFSTLDFASNNDLPYILFMPGYTATAWRHKALDDELLSKSLEEVVAMSEEFAYGDYADALLRGASLSEEDQAKVVAQMEKLTGLSEIYLKRAKLRVSLSRFAKELLRDQGKVVGRFDSRYTGPGDDGNGARMDFDPSDAAFEGIFGGAMNAYLANELEYEDERVYEIIASVWPWNYKPYVNSYVTTANRLADAMTKNPHLHTFAACGYYDLATPAFAMKHTRDHALNRKGLSSRFTMEFYEAGHMMYVYEPALEKQRKDLLRFYDSSMP